MLATGVTHLPIMTYMEGCEMTPEHLYYAEYTYPNKDTTYTVASTREAAVSMMLERIQVKDIGMVSITRYKREDLEISRPQETIANLHEMAED